MVRFILFSFIYLCFVYSCGNKQEASLETEPIDVKTNTVYGQESYQLPLLNSSASSYISQWPVFEDFRDGINSLSRNSLENLKNKTERLLMNTDSLSRKIPDTLDQRAIIARLLVTKTRVAMLNQEIRKSRLDSVAIENSFSELYEASDNLILQINEKFTKAALDLEKIENEELERKKQERFLDSVYKSELKDQNDN